MKKNELLALEAIAEGVKGAYQKPSCTILHLEAESMNCSSVRGETDNNNVSEDPSVACYTGQDD